MKRLAIIPARGGSKRIPNKNIKLFHGEPIISYALKVASEARIFDEIHVSTDCEKISSVATRLGYPPKFRRPPHLADDNATLISIIPDVLLNFKKLDQKFDTICLLYATSPLTAFTDLQEACAQVETKKEMDAILSVARFPAPIQQALVRNGEAGKLKPISNEAFLGRTQELSETFFDAGMFCFYKSCIFSEKQEKITDLRFYGYEVPLIRATDIDTLEDWVAAEEQYRLLNQNT